MENNEEEIRRKFLLKFWMKALKIKTRETTPRQILPVLGSPIQNGNPASTISALVEEDKEEQVANEISADCLTFPHDSDINQVSECLHKYGVCCLLPSCENLDKHAPVLQRCLESTERKLQALLEVVAKHDDIFTKEIVERSPGRYDLVQIDRSGNAGKTVMSGDCEESVSFALRKEALWMRVVKQVLGVTATLIKEGVVSARPGAPQQGRHRDGGHLFPPGATADGRALPAHCLTVFLPLAELRAEHGPTEFWPGTHLSFDNFVGPEASARLGPPVAFAGVPAGAAVIFDYRTLHRGGRNASGETRHLKYFTFSKPWFQDSTNYSKVSLLEEDHPPQQSEQVEKEQKEPNNRENHNMDSHIENSDTASMGSIDA